MSAALSELVVGPFVDGALSTSDTGATVEVIDPSNGRLCLAIPAGSGADVDRAVWSARNAFDDGRWRDLPPSSKKRTLHALADLIVAEAQTLDALDAEEMGKPVRESFGNAAAAAELMRFYAEEVDKITGDLYGSDKHSLVVQRRVPQGVVAALVPWNFPTFVAVLKLAPALAAGNCVVLKPSELSSRSAIRLAQLAIGAGLPAGVLNIVPGLGETVGKSLGLHAGVDMLTFTGSTTVGKLMLQYAGQSNMKVVVAECGGKSPHIVFANGVNLDAVAATIARGLLTNQGQLCSVGTRLLVERSVEIQLLDRIAACFNEAVIGPALDLRTTFGPVASSKHCTRIMHYIETARAAGAQLFSGGHRLLSESGGFFVEPTIFRNVSPRAALAQEEIFGPVLATIVFDDEEEAIRIANGTMYGLAAYVWTSNLSTGMRMAKSIRSSVSINAAPAMGEGAGYAAAVEPFGQSGFGVEGGLAGMETYMRRQLLTFNHA